MKAVTNLHIGIGFTEYLMQILANLLCNQLDPGKYFCWGNIIISVRVSQMALQFPLDSPSDR
jgi:hypothetical protein